MVLAHSDAVHVGSRIVPKQVYDDDPASSNIQSLKVVLLVSSYSLKPQLLSFQ